MYNGIINVYKETGFTSHDVVAKLRGILGQKKIGHTGTLDPDASGVLPVCLGSGTRLCEMLTDKEKEYQAVLLLGTVTDTQDTSGRILYTNEVTATGEEVRQAVESFVGEYEQVPPMYSAVKVNGKKLYELAREGKEIERSSRRVTIRSIRITGMELPRVMMTVVCSRGTYIRTLCHDIGRKLGCGGAMEALVRTRSGEFRMKEAHTLSEIEAARDGGTLREIIFPVDAFFAGKKKVIIKDAFRKLTDNGNSFHESMTAARTAGPENGEEVRVYGEDGRFYGIFAYREEEKIYQPVKMFPEK